MFKMLNEYIHFLIGIKKWWMIPLIAVIFLAMLLFVVAETTSVLPFIYALF